MVCVVYSQEVLPGEKRDKFVEGSKKLFKYDKETFGQDAVLMVSKTGKANRVVSFWIFESVDAHDKHMKELWADAGYNELFKEIMQGQEVEDLIVPGSATTEYYDVME